MATTPTSIRGITRRRVAAVATVIMFIASLGALGAVGTFTGTELTGTPVSGSFTC
jgi:hypothetical protein